MKIQANLDSFFRWLFGAILFFAILDHATDHEDFDLFLIFLGTWVGVELICYLAHHEEKTREEWKKRNK